MPKDRFARRTHLDKLNADKAYEVDQAGASRGKRKGDYREYHLRLLRELLAAPEYEEPGRSYAVRALRWLEENPAHRLSLAQSTSFQRAENAVFAKRRGVEPVRSLPSLRLRNQPREVIFKDVRPAWMKDPSLLPKKPPGR